MQLLTHTPQTDYRLTVFNNNNASLKTKSTNVATTFARDKVYDE